MRLSLTVGALLACALAGVLAGPAAAVNVPSTTLVDRSAGYAISLPSAWQLVPRSKAALDSLIATLKRKKGGENAALASTYESIAGSASGVRGLTAYRLQAFAWPPTSGSPLLTEVSVGIVGDSKAYGHASLTELGDEYANALASNAGSKIVDPREVTLPAGKAEYIEGTIPAGEGLANGVELYLIPHGLHVYELSFTIDARGLAQATLFTSIADHFAFV